MGFSVRVLFLILVAFAATGRAHRPGEDASPTGCGHALSHYYSATLSKEVVLVIDPYSSGSKMGLMFRAMGVPAHVAFSTPTPLENFERGMGVEGYESQRFYNGNYAQFIREMRKLGITQVVSPSEPGVGFAHRVAVTLGVPHNDDAFHQVWRDKFLMHETIRLWNEDHPEEPIAYARQEISNDIEALIAWQRKPIAEGGNGGLFPVILKPRDSSGTRGVNECSSEQDMRDAFAATYGTWTTANTLVDQMIAMEFLPGKEVVYDAIFRDGMVLDSELVEYVKNPIQRPDGTTVRFYDVDKLLPFDGERADQIREYGRAVARAFGIRNGAVHIEIMMTERGPVLVELGARLVGAGVPLAAKMGTGYDPVELLAMSYAFPDEFKRLIGSGFRLELRNHVWIVQLLNFESGTLEATPYLEELRSMPGINPESIKMYVKPGDRMVSTDSLGKSPGQVLIAHEDPAVVEATYKWLRSRPFFVVRPDPTPRTVLGWSWADVKAQFGLRR